MKKMAALLVALSVMFVASLAQADENQDGQHQTQNIATDDSKRDHDLTVAFKGGWGEGRYERWLAENKSLVVDKKEFLPSITPTGMGSTEPEYVMIVHYHIMDSGDGASVTDSKSEHFILKGAKITPIMTGN